MAPRRWASADEEEFVNLFYEKYQHCQARRDYTTFWNPFYEAWGARFPEWLVVFPEIPLDEELNVEQKQIVSAMYDQQKLQLMYKLHNNWGSSKASRKAKNTGEKTRQSLVASIAAPQRAHSLQSHEAYSKLYFTTHVKPAVDAEVQCLQHLAKLGNGMDEEGEKDIDTTTGDRSSSSMEKEVKAEVAAYIECLNEKKIQDLEAAKTGEGIDPQVTIDRLGGPTPALGGKIDVSSFHVGCTEMGNLFSDAYPDFNSTIMKPWVEFINCVHPTAAAKGFKKDCSMESINPEKGTISTMSKSIDTMNTENSTMSESSNITAATLPPPLDESDELNLLANGFFASPKFSQLRKTSGQGAAYAPGLILPQPSLLPQSSLPQTYHSPPLSMCTPTPSTTTALLHSIPPAKPPTPSTAMALSHSIPPAKPVYDPPSLTEFLQDFMKEQTPWSPSSCPVQVAMDTPSETTQNAPRPQSSPGVPPQIQLPAVIHPQTPLLPEHPMALAIQNQSPPAAPVQGSLPSTVDAQ
ncbi:hypothetical protein F4604DRAFT_1925596 [Suillus subluteus]|nr:hypothetical protein F4604DRAFT_1925596 [Suillus subluteus]